MICQRKPPGSSPMSDFVATELRDHFDGGDLFRQVCELEGELFRSFANRRTLKVEIAGRFYFVKIHLGVGWPEIIKNLTQGRLPVLGARNEWLALERLHHCGVPTMTASLFCERGRNPANRRSAIMTEALEHKISLEDFVTDDPLVKRRILEQVAIIARDMHGAGLNHRDFYLCHFLMDVENLSLPRLHLIDLHRAQIRDQVPTRWQVKDIGGLLFSAFDKHLTRRDLLRFVRTYSGGNLRAALKDVNLWRQVIRRATRLYLQEHHELPVDITSLLASPTE